MVIQLVAIPDVIQGSESLQCGGKLPPRMRELHMEAARSFMQLMEDTEFKIVLCGMYRSAEAQQLARRTKVGTQPVAYSGHNYGLSIDLDLGLTLTRMHLRYPELVDVMARYGWFCHRRDLDRSGSEAWHFNHFGTERAEIYLMAARASDRRTWAAPLEKKIQELYGMDFLLSPVQVQQKLHELKKYHGEIDGMLGPLTQEGIRAFQKAWDLIDDGKAGPITQRVLAFVTATKEIQSLSALRVS